MTDDKTTNTNPSDYAPKTAAPEPEIEKDAPTESARTPESAYEPAPAKTVDRAARRRNMLALISIIITVIAWVILSLNGIAALCVAVAGFVTGCFGLKAETRAWRNTAVTSIVASSVLIVVVAAFLIVIYIGLNSL